LGESTPKSLDRWAANTGRSEGATAEKAVPFLCAARRSFVVSYFSDVLLKSCLLISDSADRVLVESCHRLSQLPALTRAPVKHRIDLTVTSVQSEV
jgi:hypothetical protein